MYAKRAYSILDLKGAWALVQFKMEFEELKVEIPADDSDKEEKDLPSSFVSKIIIYTANSFCHLLKHLNIVFANFFYIGKEVRKQVRLFCNRIWRNFQGTNDIINFIFRFCKILFASRSDSWLRWKFRNQWCELKDPRKLLQIHCKN